MTATAPAWLSIPLKDAEAYWLERVRSAPCVALFLDFDGTISPIVPTPAEAAIDPSIKSTLEHLRDLVGVEVAIVSGRQLADVRARAGIEGIVYVGNHGLEIETHDLCFRDPQAEALRLELKRLVLRLQLLLAETTGVEIEEKGLSVAVHYRQVHPAIQSWVETSVYETVGKSQVLMLVAGKMVIDIRPRIAWNKGSAVKWVLDRLSRHDVLPIYIGDDTTDEDAFSALSGDVLTIHVGESAQTSARFWVPDVAAVRAFLDGLYAARRKHRP